MTARKFRSALFLLVVMGLMRQLLGFAALSTSYARRLHAAANSHQTMDTSTSLSVFTMPDHELDGLLDSPQLTTSMSALLLSMLSTTSSTLLDPNVEAEVLTDVSHLALDFTSLLNLLPKSLLKKTSVIGRVLVILADYIPDHSIHPEELVIQLFMLGWAIKNLNDSCSPSMEN
jgi:hypothetical protein